MSFPRYPAYKDSGVEWLGEVPAHWEVCPLKRIAVLQSGTGITAEEIFDIGLYAVYGGNGVRGFSTAFTHDGEFVLVGRQGALCGNVNYAKGRFWASEHALVATTVRTVEAWWLGALLQAMNLNQYSTSAAQPGLSAEVLMNLHATCPPHEEQRVIADFLKDETAKIDALVAEQERLIELLREKRQVVISHAVTKGLNPDAPMKPSGIDWIGDIPAHWTLSALKRVATVLTGVAKGKDHGTRTTISVPYLRVANVQDGYLNLADVASIEIPSEDLTRQSLQPGDVLMNEGGDFDKLGRGCVWHGQIAPCITQNHVFAVRPHGVPSEWLSTWIGSSCAQAYFTTRAKQSTNLASISSTNLMNLPLLLPPGLEQAAIFEYLAGQTESFAILTKEAEAAINLLKEHRSALISAAVTGQIDVRAVTQPQPV